MNSAKTLRAAFLGACIFASTGYAGDPMRIYKTYDESASLAKAAQLMPKNSQEAEALATDLIEFVKDQKEKLLAIAPEHRTFLNTVRAYDSFTGAFGYRSALLRSFQMLSDEMQVDEGEAMDRRTKPIARVSRETNGILSDRAFYHAFIAYRDNAFAQEKATLTAEELSFFEDALHDFEKEGYALDDASFERMTQLQQEISQLCLEFGNAAARDNAHIMVAKDHLLATGVNPNFVAGCEVSVNDAGVEECKVLCDAPSQSHILRYCSDAAVRREWLRAYRLRGYPANKETLAVILQKRHELATLLGYESYADYSLSDLMIKGEKNALAFVEELRLPAYRKAQSEHDFLLQHLPEGVTLTDDNKLHSADAAYARACYEGSLGVDFNEIAKYFPLTSTIEGVFRIYEAFMGVSFEHHHTLSDEERGGFHPETQAITVYTKDRSRVLGQVFLDLFPRPGKYSHFCCFPHLPSFAEGGYYCPETDSWEHPVSVCSVIGNFPRPQDGKESLLPHGMVQTFFHEFGHAMHFILGSSSFYETTGFDVKHDFVELPSQILEEWMFDDQVVQEVSSYYQDEPDGSVKKGDVLPLSILAQMRANAKMTAGGFLANQLSYSQLALDYYNGSDEKNPDDLLAAVQRNHALFSPGIVWDAENHFYAAFGHLTGYGPRYYGYMYSKAYAYDVFAKLKEIGAARGENGLLAEYEVDTDGNPLSAGAHFVHHILRPGGSVHPAELLENLLGRPASSEAFCKYSLED